MQHYVLFLAHTEIALACCKLSDAWINLSHNKEICTHIMMVQRRSHVSVTFIRCMNVSTNGSKCDITNKPRVPHHEKRINSHVIKVQCRSHGCVCITLVHATAKSYELHMSPMTKEIYISKERPLAHNSSEMRSLAKSPHKKSPEL